MESQNESFGDRQKATAEMRVTASLLEEEARRWRDLADALDETNGFAASSGGPYLGEGSYAEETLWKLAQRARPNT